MEIKLDEFLKMEHITKAYEVIGEWEFVIENCPERLKIKVVKRPDGKFIGMANFLIQEPGRSNPYLSYQIKDSVYDALKESIAGFWLIGTHRLPIKLSFSPMRGTNFYFYFYFNLSLKWKNLESSLQELSEKRLRRVSKRRREKSSKKDLKSQER